MAGPLWRPRGVSGAASRFSAFILPRAVLVPELSHCTCARGLGSGSVGHREPSRKPRGRPTPASRESQSCRLYLQTLESFGRAHRIVTFSFFPQEEPNRRSAEAAHSGVCSLSGTRDLNAASGSQHRSQRSGPSPLSPRARPPGDGAPFSPLHPPWPPPHSPTLHGGAGPSGEWGPSFLTSADSILPTQHLWLSLPPFCCSPSDACGPGPS